MELLRCPKCYGNLQLDVFEKNNDEIIEGLLFCTCNSLYPIIDCVPRFIDEGIGPFPHFIEKYKETIKNISEISENQIISELNKSREDYNNILKSFSEEWNIFDYDDDKTWGWKIDERKKVFIDDMGLESAQLKGKLLLDAGCGNGSMTSALSDFGMEVIGFDIHMGLGKAHENKTKFAKNGNQIHFVQGNLFSPPFKKESFDLIYCSGVIHHTPNSRETFEKILPLTKKDGRAYFWVYKKRGLPVRIFTKSGRWLNKHLSLKSMYKLCLLLSPFYKVAANVLSSLHIMEFRKRTSREITLDLFDAFTPRFNHVHHPSEVISWFSEHNFSNITVSGVQKHGFGVYGNK